MKTFVHRVSKWYCMIAQIMSATTAKVYDASRVLSSAILLLLYGFTIFIKRQSQVIPINGRGAIQDLPQMVTADRLNVCCLV